DPAERPETESVLECLKNIEPFPERQSCSSPEPQNEEPETKSIIYRDNIDRHSHSEASSPEYLLHPHLNPQDVFFEKVGNIPNTIIILKVEATGEILGGYNNLAWRKPRRLSLISGNKYLKTEEAFIFSL
ncbi:106_t:CDS:2, partial [Cetraspora pellucida]